MIRIFEFDEEKNVYKAFIDIDRPEFLNAVAEFDLEGNCINGLWKGKITITEITKFWNKVVNQLTKR